jgi:hypothetical protein
MRRRTFLSSLLLAGCSPVGKKFYIRNINAGNNKPVEPVITSIVVSNITQVKVTWAVLVGVSYYTLRRTSTGNPVPVVIANNLQVNTYTDTTVLNGITYSYTVSATNFFGEGLQSLPVSVVIAPANNVNYVVYNNGQLTNGGTHTTIVNAIAVMVPGDILELRSATAGTTTSWATNIDFTNINGTEANHITLQVRAGDTIIIRPTSATTNALNIVNSSYVDVLGPNGSLNGLQLGDIRDFVHTNFQTCYPHLHGLYVDSSTNITLKRISCSGALNYIANIVNSNCSDCYLEDISASYHGTNYYHLLNNVGPSFDDWGDLITLRGVRQRWVRGTMHHGGHNPFNMEAVSSIARDIDSSGYWADISPSPGSRAGVFNSDRVSSPYGPALIEGGTFHDSGASVDEPYQTVVKTETKHLIVRDVLFCDASGPVWQSAFTSAPGVGGQMSNICLYHNTTYATFATWLNVQNAYVAANGSDNYENNRIANNIFQGVSDSLRNTVSGVPYVVRYDTSSFGLNGYPNGLHGSTFFNNIYGGPGIQTMVVMTVPGSGANNFTVDAPTAAFIANVFQNVVGIVSFTNIGTPRNRTRTGFDVTAWPAGTVAGDAAPLTTTTGTGTNSTNLFVNDAHFFYDGWGIKGEVGDYIYIGTTASTAIPSQISSINYTTNNITLVAPISWVNGQGVWFGGNAANGSVQIYNNRGINQP